MRDEGILCSGYPTSGVNYVLEVVVYFGLVWLVWYLAVVEVQGGGRSAVAPKGWIRVPTNIFAILFGLGIVCLGLQVRLLGHSGTYVYWNIMAAPYFVWGLTIAFFYGHDLTMHFAGRAPS